MWSFNVIAFGDINFSTNGLPRPCDGWLLFIIAGTGPRTAGYFLCVRKESSQRKRTRALAALPRGSFRSSKNQGAR